MAAVADHVNALGLRLGIYADAGRKTCGGLPGSLWSMLAAPLIAGTDLAGAAPSTIALLTNRAVLAVDQDPLGRPATVVSATGGLDVLARPLANGDVAVALFNETDTTTTITTSTSAVGAPAGTRTLTDLWSGATTTTTGGIRATVPAHGTMRYRLG